MIYVLYNPCAGNNKGEARARELKSFYHNKNLLFINMMQIDEYVRFFSGISQDDTIILCGGDGTLNRFINDTENTILYYPIGSGNDFAHDVGKQVGEQPFDISNDIKELPYVYVGERKYRFLNGIGYGIDGYCCEIGDQLRGTSEKPINYTSIAIKGLLFHYKPTNAKVTVDGVCHTYEKVWLSPTMNGRFYGGGMMPAPRQDRNGHNTLSVMVLHGSDKLKTLAVFPSIFKGRHIRHKEMVDVLTGAEITVEFDRPTPLQIDGETILGVTSYRAVCENTVAIKEKPAYC